MSLNLGVPNKSGMDLSVKQVALPGTFMTLSVEEIDFFEHNPRKHQDAESLNSLKESVRAAGIQQPVHVTQRPGSNRYVLSQGGNSRLKVLKELFAETGEPRFGRMPCIYQEYSNETNLQVAHLIENEQRAEMCFWDKACAYGELRDIMQQEADHRLSLRELEILFQDYGLSISHKTLGLFFFAEENLSVLGQMAVDLSTSKTEVLRKLHGTLSAESKRLQQQELFDDFWLSSVENWVSNHTVFDAVELADFIDGQFREIFDTTDDTDPPQPAPSAKQAVSADSASQKEEPAAEVDSCLQSRQGQELPESAQYQEQDFLQSLDEPSGTVHGVANPPHETEDAEQQPATFAKTDICKKLHSVIRKWLSMVNLHNCFRSHPGFKYGFYIEYPSFESITRKPGAYCLIDSLHNDAGNVFAYLSKFSGQEAWVYDDTGNPGNPILTLGDASKLKIAYQDPDKLDEFNIGGIGDRSNLLVKVFDWQTEKDHPYQPLIEEIISLTKQFNVLGEDDER
ncbi:hypothetical protein PL75_10115 [Neisseria arctica]|uniref:ParB-like N-terminal domain-containing protein n=1 Tax=Neisseria arctica TaxID=1470200 RepID=A0A0J0YPL6_9NEIS|nr:hypothetical protein PL75_10115 [Neisseria arctica]